jgi:hypothetical protein
MRRHKLESRFDRGTDFEQWYVVRYRDEELVEDLDEDDTETLGTVMVIRDLYTSTVKVKFLLHRRSDDLNEYESIVRDICRDLGIYGAEVKIVKCDLVGFHFNIRDPEDEDVEMDDNELEVDDPAMDDDSESGIEARD